MVVEDCGEVFYEFWHLVYCGICVGSDSVCHLNTPQDSVIDVEFNESCTNFPKREFGFSGYRFDPSVDMSGYIPLDKRVKNACRCEICSKNPEIARWYANDVEPAKKFKEVLVEG